MYVIIDNIEGEKTIDLSYPIWGKEVAVVIMFSDSVQYEFTEPRTIQLGFRNKWVTAGTTYTSTRRELIDLVEGDIKLTKFDDNPQINRTNKLVGITEVVFTLNQLHNANNLENGRISNTSLTYRVTAYDDYTHFEPLHPST